MAAKVVLTFAPAETHIDEEALRQGGAEFQIKSCGLNEDELIGVGGDADVLIVLGVQPFTRRVLESFEKCRMLASATMGWTSARRPSWAFASPIIRTTASTRSRITR